MYNNDTIQYTCAIYMCALGPHASYSLAEGQKITCCFYYLDYLLTRSHIASSRKKAIASFSLVATSMCTSRVSFYGQSFRSCVIIGSRALHAHALLLHNTVHELVEKHACIYSICFALLRCYYMHVIA